jgi:tape measure domain-containing protein
VASEDLILRMRAAGTSAFVGSVHAGAAAVEETAKAGGRATRSLKNAASAMSRFAQRGALGLGGVAAAAVGFGLKFNASMEQSQVAFTNLLGSGAKAHAMLDQLYALAAKTPFEFPELVKSTQMLLGFGMAADKVVPTMKAIGDAVSAAGGGSEQISVITRAFGQMQAKGKTSLEEINQMAEGGVPALKLMADQMHMSTGRLQKEISAGHVSAQKGIDALVAGIQKRYKGMSAAQSKTFAGQISTLKDYANQAAGALTQPLFTWMRNKALPRATHFAQDITNIMSSHVLTTSGKEAAIQASFERWFSPLGRVLQRTIAAANIPEKLGRAFRSAMPRVADAMAAGAPVALNAFWGAFSSMGGGGQALTVAFLATKFGLTGGILRRLGSWAFGRFRGGFRGGLGGGQLATGVMTVRAGVVNVNGEIGRAS